jgi:hypothetical protein
MKKLMIISGMVLAMLSACKKEDNEIEDISIVSGIKTISVPFSTSKPFTLFRFSDSSIVANADSATNIWDFGVKRTTFIVNSNASGPGSAGVVMQTGTTFDAVASAPAMGYAYDTTSTSRAIKDGSWYTYNTSTHNFVPNAGNVFIFKTGGGNHYAKMEILEITSNGNLSVNPPVIPTTLYYKVRYSYQSDGTLNFK